MDESSSVESTSPTSRSISDGWDKRWQPVPYVKITTVNPDIIAICYQGHSLKHHKSVSIIDKRTKRLLGTQVYARYRPIYDDISTIEHVYFLQTSEKRTVIYQQVDIDDKDTRTWCFLKELQHDQGHLDIVREVDSKSWKI